MTRQGAVCSVLEIGGIAVGPKNSLDVMISRALGVILCR